MKKKRKKIALFQAVVMLVLSVCGEPNYVRAGQNAIVKAEDMVGKQGEEIQIPVKISGNTGIMGFQINVNYDEKYLTPLKTTCGDVISGVFDDNIEISKDSHFDILWSGTEDNNQDGILFYMTFRVKETAPKGTTQIELSYLQEDTFDESYEDVILDCRSVNLTIKDEPAVTLQPTAVPTNTPDPSDGYVVGGEDVTAKPGEEISVPVNISKNAGIIGFMMTVSYDADLLTPVSVKAGDVIPAGTVFDDNCTSAEEAVFKILWAGTKNIYEEGCLFTLKFKVKENLSETTTRLDLSYLKKETFDENYKDVSLQCQSISIHISDTVVSTPKPTDTLKPTNTPKPTGTPEPTRTPEATAPVSSADKYVIYGDEVKGGPDENVSVPVYIKNNMGLCGFLMTVKYDADSLSPVSVVKGEVLPAGTTFDDTCDPSDGGSYKILWAGTKEIVDDGCIYTLNFKIKKDVLPGKTKIEISYKKSDTFNEEYKDVELNCKDIQIEIVEKTEVSPVPTQKPPESKPTSPATSPPASVPQVQKVSPTTNPNRSKESEIKKKSSLSSDNKAAKVIILKVKTKGKKKLYVKWKKQKNVAGYQIQYADNRKFKKKKMKKKKYGQSKITLKKLKSKRYYYIRIRSYVNNNGKMVYGKWSKVRKLKTK